MVRAGAAGTQANPGAARAGRGPRLPRPGVRETGNDLFGAFFKKKALLF
jgi:hypothetical protein